MKKIERVIENPSVDWVRNGAVLMKCEKISREKSVRFVPEGE